MRAEKKPAPPPFSLTKQSYCGHQKYINICTFVIFKKKGNKTSLAPCGWFLTNEVICGKAESAPAHVKK